MIQAKNWQILPKDQRENTLHLRRLLNIVRKRAETMIQFEPGTYHFYPDYAVEKTLCISNHDEDTLKRIAFDLTGCKDLVLKGNQTHFIFHTEILPFYLHQCQRVTICGITIDYQRPGYSEGIIRELHEKRMTVEIDRHSYPYEICNNRIFFKGEDFCHEITHGCLEMDGERLAPVYGGHDISFNKNHPASYGALFKEISDNQIEISLVNENQKFLTTSKVGNRLIFRHHPRSHPAFYITDSTEIVCEDITLYYCPGMAVISQFTEHIRLERFHVRMHPEKKRIFTAAADGFHMVYAKGKIHIKDCHLENQLDDPVNIHGIYVQIQKQIDDYTFLGELVEGMQKGVPLGRSGDTIGLVDQETMLTMDTNTLEEIEMLNKDYLYLKFKKPVTNAKPGDVLENLSYIPDVLIEGCTFRNNRARGLLLTSGGKVEVRNNTFCNAGAAILIEGDSNYWFESGAIHHILVTGNRFRDCAYVTDWGQAPIQVSPSARKNVEGKCYHNCLEIRNNEFWCFDKRLIKARGIKTIIFEDNVIHPTDTFPAIPGEAFELENVVAFRGL